MSGDVAIEQTVKSFVLANYYLGGDGAEFLRDTSLLNASVIDSTGILELVQFLEETFGIDVADNEITAENLDSLGKVANLVSRKRDNVKGAAVES